jgi:adenosylcobinamide-phosphate synthase
MSFLILLAALLLAHYRPLPSALMLSGWHAGVASLLDRSLNDGQARHGVLAWVLAALLPAVLIGASFYLLRKMEPMLAAPWGLLLMYLMLDFRGFGTVAETIAATLRNNNIQDARILLSGWSGHDAEAYGAPEVARVAIETTLVRAHYELFAPMFWFVLLGPGGAALYCFSRSLDKAWVGQDTAFNRIAHQIFYRLDWLSARFTATAFAVAGDFEDALYCWRTQAATWGNETLGIMLSSGAGALGVRLGEPLPSKGVLEYRPELGLGDAADADYLMSTVGLIWRVLVLMLALMLLMTFASWLGK